MLSTEEKIARERSLMSGDRSDAPKVYGELHSEMVRCNRYDRPVSIVLIRGQVKDGARGPALGSFRANLFRKAQTAAMKAVRFNDSVGRLSDDELLIILPETPLDGAQVTASKIIAANQFRQMVVQAKKAFYERFDCGVSLFETFDMTVDGFLERTRDGAQEIDAFLKAHAPA